MQNITGMCAIYALIFGGASRYLDGFLEVVSKY